MAAVDIGALLLAVENSSPVEAIDALSDELRRGVGARHVALLIANVSGDALVRMAHVSGTVMERDGHDERAGSVPIAGTAYGRVLLSQAREVVPHDRAFLALVPITERGDAIGVLEVSFVDRPSDTVLDDLVRATHAWTYALVASRRHTDLFEWAQRDVPFSVSAEIQRRLLPSSYTVEAGPLTLAGWLEPSHEVGGDTFDYSLDREYLYLSITDAMGHDTTAALLATLAVSTLRNQRRSLATPAAQADATNATMNQHAGRDQFVTGFVGRVRLADGRAELVNAGHPLPFLLRDGSLTELRLATQLPFGLASEPYNAELVSLEPGDRLLMVTDGYLDRLDGRLDVEDFLRQSLDRHPRQVVQDLGRAIREVTDGNLGDDATALCLDWYGPAGRRDATGGASRARATQGR